MAQYDPTTSHGLVPVIGMWGLGEGFVFGGAGLVPGALVRWPAGPGSPLGVVVGTDGNRVEVRLDGIDEVRVFNARSAGIERVPLQGIVRRVSNGAIGSVHAQATAAPPRWQVLVDQRIITVAEADLRPHAADDARSRILAGRLGSARQFALAITARRCEIAQMTSDLVALGESRVAVKPHQVSVVHRVITSYPHRFLLCDEVGLGKTIEAGMILKELRARGGAGRCIVIAPANLLRQWQFELKSKFNETFSIINSDTVRYLRQSRGFTGNPFEIHDNVIVSSSWITADERSKQVSDVSWDIVIVDEAHHARVHVSGRRREETRLYRVVRDLVSPDAFSKRAALFLTATPMQLDSGELYSLIELLDPALFPTEQHFDRHRGQMRGLSRLVRELSEGGFPPPGLDASEVAAEVAAWLEVAPEIVDERLRAGTTSVAEVCAELSARHLLSEILIRNRKKTVGGFMPRQAHRWDVKLTDEERRALEAVEEFVRDGYARADRTNDQITGFVMVTFQKLMASSIRALRTSLSRRAERLRGAARAPSAPRWAKTLIAEIEDRLDQDDYISALLDEVAVADIEEAAELDRLVALLDDLPKDSKADTLLAQLRELEEHGPGVKVLLFTEFRETQEYLRQRITEIGWDVRMFHGQMSAAAKDDAVDAFRAATGPCILLSTEAGGEGRNFQFCHLLVNYDLPWNPMKVEQRIGRVDRIGQDNVVQVFNFWVRGTVEERVLEVLDRRINVFEETVGGLDPILGDAEHDLKKILRLSGEERDRALIRFEELVEARIQDARKAEEKLRDFIMETKSYSRAIAAHLSAQPATVAPADMERLATALLSSVNTYIHRLDDGTFEIAFHEPFLSNHPELTRDRLRRRVVAFRPDVQPDNEHVEYLALGHPVIDQLVADATAPGYAGSAAAFEIEAQPGLESAKGWLIVQEVGVPGLKEVRELSPMFVHDDGCVDPVLGQALVARAASLPNDQSLAPADVPADEVAAALMVAEAAGYARLDEMEAAAHAESGRQLSREQAKLTVYFDYRDQAARDRLASSRQVLAQLEAAEDQERRRIIPVWRANVARDERLISELTDERQARLADLGRRAAGTGDLRLAAIARVEIYG
ncbi:MAG TPA: helicase-related protein [Streptosporangiaceae bacterium]|nr:helicase-related protein [Streptosporangiaceae bacterium]